MQTGSFSVSSGWVAYSIFSWALASIENRGYSIFVDYQRTIYKDDKRGTIKKNYDESKDKLWKARAAAATIRDMRYPVEIMLDLLAAGMTTEEILEDYPDLEKEDIQACILFANETIAFDAHDGKHCQ